jgi:hypothetical protein
MMINHLHRHARNLRRLLRPRGFKEFIIQQELNRLGRNCYLEIGVRTGDSLRYLNAKRKLGVDPERTAPMATLRAGEEFFEMTSDHFFAGPAEHVLGGRVVDVCLVDGLHTFRQSLADVLNAAKWMREDGAIVVDDCFPDTADKAALEPHGRAWTGDVWKTMAILRKTQPQWDCHTLDLDEGTGVITGFAHPQRPIADALIEEFSGLGYEALAADPGLIGLVRS